ncbi:MAG TPA: NAD(P)H-binding protein [Humibacter sp.]|nr:NAD(P)H-binding protein [Humibacter sp.]
MTSRILVTGGTGTVGSLVVPRLRAAGNDVTVLSRRAQQARDGIRFVTGDLLKGEGVAAAVEGMDTILHLAGGPKGDDIATRNLVRAARAAGVKHIVLISVVGAATMPIGYFTAKRGAEHALMESGVPWTVLRAAQFHTLAFTVIKVLARLPVILDPRGLRAQPVDPEDVAARLVELTLGEPLGLAPDEVGPRVYTLAELVASYLRARGKRRPVLPLHVPGRVARAYRAGENLALDGVEVGTRSWEDFLAKAVAEQRFEH